MIRTTSLDNGLQIVTEHMADVRSVALSFWVGTGSRDETPAEWGISHFLEHLLFKGSAKRSAFDIAKAIDGVGGDMNAFTTKECTSFYVRVLAEDVDLGLDILCDIMCDPALDATEMESERQVILEEILMLNDEPSELVHELFSRSMFEGHPLGRDILGDKANIESVTANDVRSFFQSHYRPRNLVFAAAGAVDHDRVADEVARRWQGRDGGSRPERKAPTPPVSSRHVVHKRSTDQAHLVAGVSAPDRHSPQRYAAAMLDTVFGGGMSSRLFQEVREKNGLAYSVFSSYAAYDDAGEFGIYIGTAPAKIAKAADIARAEMEKVATSGITADELDRAKRHAAATTALGLEDSAARMSRIGRSMLLHGKVLSVDEVAARIQAVTVDEVNALAAELFQSPRVAVAVGHVPDKVLKGLVE